MISLLLIGGGGHCKSSIDVIETEGKYKIAGIVNQSGGSREQILGYDVLGDDVDLPELFKKYTIALIPVGQIKSADLRVKLYLQTQKIGFELPTGTSSRAYVSRFASLGVGTIVMHDALVNTGAKIGNNCILNTKSLVEHDGIVEDHCHISTSSIVNGGILVREQTFVGSNATKLDHIEIGEKNIVGGGSDSAIDSKSIKNLTIGYFADGPWSYQALAKLIADSTLQIAFVCARFDNPDPVLKKIASENEIDFLTHPKVNSEEFLESITKYECDLFISMSFNQIFKKRLIECPPERSINCHAGKLPFYRGRNILNWALINDETEFGITVHYMDEGIDTGDIIVQKCHPISDEDDYSTLLERAYIGCSELLYQAVKIIQSGASNRISQRLIHPTGFYCSDRRKGDEVLNWNQTSREVFNFVRAICRPGPQARTSLNNNEILINRVEWIPNAPIYIGIPGAVLKVERNGFVVKTEDSFVRVLEWTSKEVIKVGDRFK